MILLFSVRSLTTVSQPIGAESSLYGIKQLLEKKEGLFRMNMMGKRVNFAARSVISPDVNLATNEVGFPTAFARTLAVKEAVSGHNYERLVRAVINGAHEWPGANVVVEPSGRVLSLASRAFETREARVALARRLMSGGGAQPYQVHRHIVNGDYVLMNRQPSLHKPSIMGHRVRVLGGDRVLRMHYANWCVSSVDYESRFLIAALLAVTNTTLISTATK